MQKVRTPSHLRPPHTHTLVLAPRRPKTCLPSCNARGAYPLTPPRDEAPSAGTIAWRLRTYFNRASYKLP